MSWPALAEFDGRQPWHWPDRWRRCCAGGLWALGVVLAWPLWDAAWVAWQDTWAQHARDRADQASLAQLTQDVQDQRQQLTQWSRQPLPQAWTLSAVTQVVQRAASQQGLQLLQLATQSDGGQNQLTLSVQGGAAAGWRWLRQVSEQLPGVLAVRLQMSAAAAQGLTAQVTWQWADAASTPATQALLADPAAVGFDAQAWQQVQRRQAEQQPSFIQWVQPELARPREELEHFALSRLRYVGLIASPRQTQALVQVMAPEAALSPVHRVAVGDHLGAHFGRLQAIDAQQLQVREIVRDAAGVWGPQQVLLPLVEASSAERNASAAARGAP